MSTEMNHRSIVCVLILGVGAAIIGAANSASGDPATDAPADPVPRRKPDVRFTTEVAEDRAKLMHRIYVATLDTMHHHYFHANRSVLPARAMEDIFTDVAKDTHSTARWISVNTKPMSVDHEPITDFEKKAAAEIATGKPEFSAIENGHYRRAGAIPLTAGCVSCHTGFFNDPAKTPRYAALVISIPVRD